MTLIFKTETIHLTNEKFFQRIKRRLFAKPVISFTKDGYYTLSWHWNNGKIEVVEQGKTKPAGLIKIPYRTRVIREI